ncbi:mRNA interferase MazF9 [Campylobacter hyointestinalis subsp. hyointestinalis]|uniref:mRNA interferase MazF9 n=1 Tax=Campylobacter hyointestinalis subsp. hyointestinalis TaxID=91352 RepID=A0A9W5AU80_CAMHY|nr:type II toxin-antitoxin system PemK/MazF family toxin [Campylobacter hyointestinalis]CUU70588.1 mRNA interferase MazF9 [Campylobacter hyointestinalis subsp. hyointestinalis]CUU70591.1 mRNA interferase MazF9 [Campylobacter hyointestinalis subsp. hyointestinalis]CUU85673.1 mRNA interferase MazF9 [Campylobacter hyointestinalis subsp. hyointestinalis]
MTRYEIWFLNLDPTIGAEIQKTGPCVIVSPPQLDYLKTRIIAPITSKGFEAPYRLNFKLLGKDAKILCDQIRSVSVDRFVFKVGELSLKHSKELSTILKEMF